MSEIREGDRNHLAHAISDAIEAACEALGARCYFTREELEEGQGWADYAASEEDHEVSEDIRAGMAQREGRAYEREPFDPSKRVGSARCYAMMILRYSKRSDAFLAAPTLEAKLALLGVSVDDPLPLADHVAVLESSARGDFAHVQQRSVQ